MTVLDQERLFLQNPPVPVDSALLQFSGTDGLDVYNCSIPFEWEGRRHIFGRVEPHGEWAASHVFLFAETAPDCYERVRAFDRLILEDPFVQWIGGEFILGGTFVTRVAGGIRTYASHFFRGPDPLHLRYYTTGPDFMKDIRLIERPSGRIGFFSRPRSEEVRAKYGSESIIGYGEIDSLDQLTPEVIEAAAPICGILGKDEWGGVNQCYALPDGRIGLAAHIAANGEVASNGRHFQHYCNAAFVFDPDTGAVTQPRIVATRALYPDAPAKLPHLADCAFTSGFVFRDDGLVDLYSGLGDAAEGRITIPFAF